MANTHLSFFEPHSVKVFISSTFRDLKQEREYLSNITFPILREYYRKRNCILFEQDLRWGITQQDSLNGKTVELCLEGIKQSRPFFIGIIGERYGWIPSPQEISDMDFFSKQYPYLAQGIYEGRSMTEMEFLFGALQTVNEDIEAAFFIKEVSPSNDEPAESQEKLSALKNRVRSQSRFPVFPFKTVTELSDGISQYLTGALNRRFPAKEMTFTQYVDQCQASLLTRLADGYIPREELRNELYKFVDLPDFSCATVHGDAGSGKTALLCDFLRDLKKNRPLLKTIFCAVGATAETCSKYGIARYFQEKIGEMNGVNVESDFGGKDDRDILDVLQASFSAIESPENVLLILDGVDGLNIEDHSHELRWLPKLPQGMKVIFTVRLPNHQGLYYYAVRGTEALFSIGFHISTDELTPPEIIQISRTYLDFYGKSMDDDLFRLIGECPVAKHASSLCFLLDELRYFGSHEDLAPYVQKLTATGNKNDLLRIILDHIGKEMSRPDGIKEIFFFLQASRYGLTEKEIMGLTNLTGLDWAVFSSLSQSVLSIKSGLIDVADWINLFLVEQFKIDVGPLVEYRKRIVSFFSKMKEKGLSTDRTTSEIPWQLLNLGDYRALYEFASDIEVFESWYEKDMESFSECLMYWKPLILNGYSLDSLIDIPATTQSVEVLYHLSLFCKDNEMSESRFSILTKLYNYYQSAEIDETERHVYLGNIGKQLADIAAECGRMREAEINYERALAAYETGGWATIYDRAQLLTDYGWMYYRFGEYTKAINKYEESKELFKEMMDKHLPPEIVLPSFGLMASNEALAYSSINEEGMQENALEAAQIADRVAQDLLKIDPIGYAEEMLRIEKSVIGIYLLYGNLKEAKTLFGYTESVFVDQAFRYPHRMAAVYGEVLTNMATVIYIKEAQPEEAAKMYDKAIEQLNHYYMQTGRRITSRMAFGSAAFYYRAEIYKDEGNFEKAFDCYSSSVHLSCDLFLESAQIQQILCLSIKGYVDLAFSVDKQNIALNDVTPLVLQLQKTVNDTNKLASATLVKIYEFLGHKYMTLSVSQNSVRLLTDAARILGAVINDKDAEELIHYFTLLGELAFNALKADDEPLAITAYEAILENRTVSLLSSKDVRLLQTYIDAAEFFLNRGDNPARQEDYASLALSCYVQLHAQGIHITPTNVLLDCFCLLQSRSSDQLTPDYKESLFYSICFVRLVAEENGMETLSEDEKKLLGIMESLLPKLLPKNHPDK